MTSSTRSEDSVVAVMISLDPVSSEIHSWIGGEISCLQRSMIAHKCANHSERPLGI